MSITADIHNVSSSAEMLLKQHIAKSDEILQELKHQTNVHTQTQKHVQRLSWITILMLILTIPSFLAAYYGMNLPMKYYMDPRGVSRFWKLSLASVVGMMVIIFLIMRRK